MPSGGFPKGNGPPNSLVCTEHPCLNPSPVRVGGVDTGYDTCDGGTLRRRAIVDCPSLIPRASAQCHVTAFGPTGECVSDEDCTSQPNGYCSNCGCFYGCRRDSDCGDGQICECGDPVGTCNLASCCGVECVENEGHTECQAITVCGNGHPFLVHGSERLAECVARADWRSANLAPDLQACSASVQARLAAHWARVGLMEHASIAAFARFTLHLLAVGAPPDLVLLSQEAIGDETEHARLAFALASAYAGADMGPGALAIDGSLDGFNVADLVATLLREGCIGETVAAIEARDALESACDPIVRGVLETIARDELRHAELAWRTLGWLVASGCVSPAAVKDEMTLALKEMDLSPRPAETNDDLAAFGVLSEGRRSGLRNAAATRVISICAEPLLRRGGPTARGVARYTA